MAEPTFDDIEALVGPATPHFAFQLRARVRELIAGLPEDDPVRQFGEEKIRLLDDLGYASSKAEDDEPEEPRTRIGWDEIPSSAPAARPLPPLSEGLMGRSVLVTGGSRGIGKAIALRFAREGATRVAIGYMRSDSAAEETACELQALGAEPVLVRGNVTSERVLQQVSELGPIDVFVHNAATGVIRPALETEEKHWDWTLNSNARSFLSLTRALAPTMPPARRSWRSRASARSACSTTTPSSAHRRPRSSRSCATSRSSSGRGDSRQRSLGRRRRHGRARSLPEPRGDAEDGTGERRRTARHAGGHRRRRLVPQLTRGRDGARPDTDRRRRLQPPR